jgi:hypothetical protein
MPGSGGGAILKFLRVVGGIIGYGSLAAFLYLIAMQIYHWFREGDWTRVGTSDGLRIMLSHLGVRDGDGGRLASLLHWIDTPVDWLGLHKVLEVLPASLVLFALSILGNCLFIYCGDRLNERRLGA